MSNLACNQQAPQQAPAGLDSVPVSSTSPSSSPNLSSSFKSSPPIPAIPFSWRNNSCNSTPIATTNSSSFSPLKTSSPITFLGDTSAAAERLPTPREVKINTLPNPFVNDRNSSSNLNASSVDVKFTSPTFFSNNSSLKVPSELLKAGGGSTSPITNGNVSSSPTPSSGSNSPANVAAVGLTKLQQQNLILNCTY
ncbi:hypothetical protein DFA_03978 [Cavenderia fasciculata]|uniref:Uncharacterized protein n=1 Tax=Cavenderia fasciculata TaxID=261658 RepID=F4Q0Y3_CACFS|nr:uncharacterized protein DFA_03978 [Cavenderia fasciculata]EGG18484.1 hypothetical protein DFA_03978 [Cavenderia fasciculata]|eukprot:XP_004366388.1 hypothetical protein DFA_03978 [Cavenderia fasciculata]